MYSVIAKWDDDLMPTSVNNAATDSEAQVIVQALIDKGRTNAFYFEDGSADGQECWRIPQHWRVNAANKTAALNQSSLDAAILSVNMESLRSERNKRLTATDIVVLPDRWAAMDDNTKTAWTDHRQALRDLPATADPTNVTWPDAPS
tara:strand:+ start:395 stop:835 length:441 start_codon:yes stop_codon:yes gene_type:complete